MYVSPQEEFLTRSLHLGQPESCEYNATPVGLLNEGQELERD